MRKIAFLIVGVASLMLSSCAFHNGLTSNLNNHNTEVVLSKNNFKVVGTVTGESEAMYVFGFGGLSKNGMVAEARSRMLMSANLTGTSKAVINETVEVKFTAFPFVRLYKVIVSAHVVEFTN